MDSYQLKIRIDVDDKTAIGPGKAELLELIIETGSISAAAKRMSMSYRRAWELVEVMNECFDQPMVAKSTGGSHGGGAEVTAFGLLILNAYRQLVIKTNDLAVTEIQVISQHLRRRQI